MPRRRRMKSVTGSPPKLFAQKLVKTPSPERSVIPDQVSENLKRSSWKTSAGSSSPSSSPPAKKLEHAKNQENEGRDVPTNSSSETTSSVSGKQTAKKSLVTIDRKVRTSNSPTSTSSGSPKKTQVAARLNERDYVCLEAKANVILKDLAKGKEHFAVRLVNDVDDEKVPQFKYISSREIAPDLQPFVDTEKESNRYAPCCTSETCGQHCQEGICPCRTFSGAKITYKNFLLLYNELEMYNNATHALKECNYSCYCHNAKNKAKKGQITCYNRVFSKGAKVPLDVFRTENRGWGVRPRVPVPEGTYIGEYVGVLKKDSPSESAGGDYIHGLGEEVAIQVKTAVDACEKGNYTRFINHSCDPNLFVAKVAYESTNPGLLHLCLFTLRSINPFEEMLIDYGHSFWDAKEQSEMYCLCGTKECHHPPPDLSDDSDNDEDIETASHEKDESHSSASENPHSGSDVEDR